MAAPDGEMEPQWQREKRALEERIRQLELLQQQHPPQPPPPTSAVLHAARMPTQDEIEAMYKRLAEIVPESSTGSNAIFFSHINTIVSNLLQFPYNDPKFRRLKMSNHKLNTELLNHPSAVGALQSVIGFAPQYNDVDGERYLIVPPSDATHITTLRCVKGALPRLQQRDDIAAEAAKRFAAFRKSVAFEVRMERLAQATASEADDVLDAHRRKLDEYVVTSLSWNDADVGKKVVTLLRTITENIAREPLNDRFRTLSLTSSTLRDAVFPAQGSVEYLIAILGFHWTENGLEMSRFTSDRDVDEFRTTTAQRGCELLERAASSLEAKRLAENELRRANALAEREAEKRMLLQQQQISQRSVAAATEEVGPTSPSPPAAGKRIPIADALKILMGKRKDDDDY